MKNCKLIRHLGLLLGWMVAFFSHNLKNKDITLRIWDFLLCLKLKSIEIIGKNHQENYIEILVAFFIIEFFNIFKTNREEFQKNNFLIIKKFNLEIFEAQNFDFVFRNSYNEFKRTIDEKNFN